MGRLCHHCMIIKYYSKEMDGLQGKYRFIRPLQAVLLQWEMPKDADCHGLKAFSALRAGLRPVALSHARLRASVAMTVVV